jgi:hypothetical protein
VSLEGAARGAAVIVQNREGGPAGALLAADIGFEGFPLCVERVEILLQTLLGGFARVDRAAHSLLASRFGSFSPTHGRFG